MREEVIHIQPPGGPPCIYNGAMKENIYKVSGLILSIALITPLFAFAQTDTTGLTSQIQSLVSQITSLEQQLQSLVSSATGSTTPSTSASMWGQGAGTPPSAGGSGSGMMGMRCLEIGRNLSVGSTGSDVSQLQDMLAGEGFLSASSTGFFGQMTASALGQFQAHFGIASSTGVFGPLTRNFINGRCGGPGQGGGMGSSTPPMWQIGSSTHPMMPMIPAMPWNQASTTNGGNGGGDWKGPMGSSTPPQPCAQDDSQNMSNAAAVAAMLFVPHSILPGMMRPCVSGEMQQ